MASKLRLRHAMLKGALLSYNFLSYKTVLGKNPGQKSMTPLKINILERFKYH